MALNIKWTPQAEKGLDKVLEYLEENWTEKEVFNFEKKIGELTERISKYPKICPPSGKRPDLRKGLVDRNNYIIYRIHPKKKP
ncbi:type II toxin-antitoxin system RelE/ParE family toxin [Muricauda sp. SCSIO 64092]|uniref:type II toxin-antitoxin system RelE/ParE family toxin n=1 Tax=Allomuricauda sp. SCSIO 64092 TaxID=2908842 RepID=UPI001FF25C95|nr:type II toxin-antitoxin system RelE/ParE family toxin [Muricauda sp. SCSIO 64092]UOY06919.1 type II toxin-antitoxin system RelE/ParE family toxin [Muricauda sp. SCSIO 64092]